MQLKRIDFKGFAIYFVVGFGATIVEWILFWILADCLSINYLLATTIAMFISTFANWALGRLLLFSARKHDSLLHEILQIYAASIIGWLFNMLLMYLMVDHMHMQNMFAKVIATGIVFVYNYLVRRIVIYK